jgi:hypothetical protein
LSDTALDARINIGTSLVQSARIGMRHWPLGLLAILGMAGCLLLLLYLGSLCFGVGHAACIDVRWLAAIGAQGSALVGDAINIATLMAAFVVTVAAARLFYLAEPQVAGDGKSREQHLRLGRFIGRTALAWAIGVTPSVLLEAGYLHASWALYPDIAGPTELWIVYILMRGLSITIASYLHARLILFVPSVVYQEHPDGLRAGWDKTRSARWRIFFVLWLSGIAVAITQPVLELLASLAIDAEPLAQALAEWSSADTDYVHHLLTPMLVYAILVPIDLLWSAGFSIVVYSKLIVIDELRATLLD